MFIITKIADHQAGVLMAILNRDQISQPIKELVVSIAEAADGYRDDICLRRFTGEHDADGCVRRERSQIPIFSGGDPPFIDKLADRAIDPPRMDGTGKIQSQGKNAEAFTLSRLERYEFGGIHVFEIVLQPRTSSLQNDVF